MEQYKVTKYPDGQISVTFNEYKYWIHKRITSYEDIFILKSISDVYKHNRWYLPNVFIPCLFGQQSDRRFNENESFDLKNIAEVINSCKFPRIEILDPHSDISLALINNSIARLPIGYIRLAVTDIGNITGDNPVLISPDAGAYKKVFKFAQELNFPLVPANKYRDRQGNITLEVSGNVKGLNCLICDDIAVGARTFVELGKKLKELGANKVFLYVSHGHFTKGFGELRDNVDHVYCTNSVKDIVDDFVTQYKVI